ncbi:MAG: hypothetical protein ACI4IS_00360 [Acutalibacteraceae bacterium]
MPAIRIEIDVPQKFTINIEADTTEQLQNSFEIAVSQTKDLMENVKNGTKFISIKEAAKQLGWSEPTVQELFNRSDFPSCDFAKRKVVELSAFTKYFSVPRRK